MSVRSQTLHQGGSGQTTGYVIRPTNQTTVWLIKSLSFRSTNNTPFTAELFAMSPAVGGTPLVKVEATDGAWRTLAVWFALSPQVGLNMAITASAVVQWTITGAALPV